MNMLYGIKDRPTIGKTIIFAIQQVLAIIACTITLPLIVGNGLSQSAALFGAGAGTLTYLLFTKFKSPVFLGSSFTFLGSMSAAFAGAATAAIGYIGLIIGATLVAIVYTILSIVVKFSGTKWIDKVLPPVIIGPVVALIGLTLAPNAIANITSGAVYTSIGSVAANPYICLAVGFITLFTVIIVSIYGKKMLKLVPFIIGIFVGYSVAAIFTIIGNANNIEALQIIDFTPYYNIEWVPDFAFIHMFEGFKDFKDPGEFWQYFGLIAVLYVPIACAVFAEHIADHKNLSLIIGQDLIEEPGLHRTLLGDGIGSAVGAFFGGCPNTTYGESISTVAFSRNASIITIVVASFMAIAISFFGPLMAFCQTIPPCIVGGLSIALYGYIATSGFIMLKGVDLSNHKNIFVISTVFIIGIGGLTIQFNHFEFSPIACALVAGIIVNLLVNIPKKKKKENVNNDVSQIDNSDS